MLGFLRTDMMYTPHFPAPFQEDTGTGSSRTPSANWSVLIVDDEEPILETLAMIIEDMGLQPIPATNGEEALEAAHDHWPTLVITDLMMPRVDGEKLIVALRQEAQSTGKHIPPIILLTAGMPFRTEHIGATAVLRKPFDLDSLQALIVQLLQEQEQKQRQEPREPHT